MTSADYQGIALIIGATAALVTAVGGFAVQIVTLLTTLKTQRIAAETHVLVDGVSHELAAANKKVDFAEGDEASRSRSGRQNADAQGGG